MTDLPAYRYPGRPQRVRFLERRQRFLARVRPESGGRSFWVHLPNPGRNEELLRPGRTEGCIVEAMGTTERRTRHTLVAVRHDGTWVGLDTGISNRLGHALLESRRETRLGEGPWQREVSGLGHRWDLAQRNAAGQLTQIVEVKSSNLKIGTRASFPDAPTDRGTRHVRALTAAARHGVRAGVLFAIQREDVDSFSPNARMDRPFATALAAADRAGVRVVAWTLCVGPGTLEWGQSVPVLLDDP